MNGDDGEGEGENSDNNASSGDLNTSDLSLLRQHGITDLPARFLAAFNPALDLISQSPRDDYDYAIVTGQVANNPKLKAAIMARFSSAGWDPSKVHVIQTGPDTVIRGLTQLPTIGHGTNRIGAWLKDHYVGFAGLPSSFAHKNVAPSSAVNNPTNSQSSQTTSKVPCLRHGQTDVDSVQGQLTCLSMKVRLQCCHLSC
jgi:hypothetical protein